MALVDYSSSDSASQESLDGPPVKRRCKALGVDAPGTDHSDPESKEPSNMDKAEAKPQSGPGGQVEVRNGHNQSDMPPLPLAFHDLYASTVRQSVADDPSLHQGRKRQTPHVQGNWPSHVYVEWHLTANQHDILVQLLGAIESEVGPRIRLKKFSLSDLGAPLPLHISLSRPLTLTTANKDAFLEKLESAIRSHTVSSFSVAPANLAWYKSPDSDRLFLIVRVASYTETPSPSGSQAPGAPNPELAALLRRCNGVTSLFNQPRLYQRSADDMNVGAAFHVSVAWTFDAPDARESLRSLSVFKEARFRDMPGWEIPVTGIKVKIGNAVHHVPLGGHEGRPSWSSKSVGDEDGAFKG